MRLSYGTRPRSWLQLTAHSVSFEPNLGLVNVVSEAEESGCPLDRWVLLSAVVHTSVHGLWSAAPRLRWLAYVTVLISLLWITAFPCLAVEGISCT